MAGDSDPTTRFRRKRGVSKVIDELIDEGEFDSRPSTIKESRVYCKYCDVLVPGSKGTYGFIAKHRGPCGLPCLAGGVEVGRRFHCDRCPICYPPNGLDVFPEGTKLP